MSRRRVFLSRVELEHLREQVRQRAGYRCEDCGGLGPIQVHHLVKRSLGGVDELTNLRALCVGCHAAKHPHMA